jgi:hypothetical protein
VHLDFCPSQRSDELRLLNIKHTFLFQMYEYFKRGRAGNICRSVTFLLTLASTVILGFRSRRDLRPSFLFSPRHERVWKWSLSFYEGRGSVFLARSYVCCTILKRTIRSSPTAAGPRQYSYSLFRVPLFLSYKFGSLLTPDLEDYVRVFMSPSDRVAQLYS